MNSATDIANFALAQLGEDTLIDNLDTDQSKPARVMRRNYYTLLRTLLESTNWFWATSFQKLTLQSIYPVPEWPFCYNRPNNCVRMTRIWNWGHTDTLENDIKYLPVNNGTQRVILSEFGPTAILQGTPWQPIQPTLPLQGNMWPIPVAQFIGYTDNVSLMPEMFKEAFGFILAAYGAPSLPGIGQENLREQNLKIGNGMLTQAIANDQNEARQFVDLRSVIQKAGQGEWGRGEGNVGYRAYNAGNFEA